MSNANRFGNAGVRQDADEISNNVCMGSRTETQIVSNMVIGNETGITHACTSPGCVESPNPRISGTISLYLS